MKTILIITDQTPEAEHAAAFALMIAQTVHADVLIADTVRSHMANSQEAVLACGEQDAATEQGYSESERLSLLVNPQGSYIPVIREMDVSDYQPAELIAMINREGIWLLVEGMPHTLARAAANLRLDIQSVLNRVRCPLLLVPQSWVLKKPERVVYLADLRYCRQFVLKFLAVLAAPFDARISITHLSAKGLTDIVEHYAAEIFQKEIVPHTPYKKITLNNTSERDLHRAVDVLINGMHHDLMVLVNHRYHFEELIGRSIGDVLPADITIPVLVFPL